MRLLIVEDNQRLAEWLAKLLRNEIYVVDVVPDAEIADEGVEFSRYDLAIVDLGLPGMSGVELIRRARARGASMPILILTADDRLQSRVEGLNAGADDYLTKPFEVAELEARLRALLRRSGTTVQARISFGPLTLDQNTRLFTLSGEPLHLSPREHLILETLLRRAGSTVSKEQLLESTYGFDDAVNQGAIEVIVHRVRKKLGGSSISIATLRGLGYLLRLEAK